jgi:hypothetical protein
MKHINNYEIFLEEMNPNTPQGYLKSLSKPTNKKPLINKNQKPTPTQEVDNILQQTEEQKQRIIARKDAIEKGLLNNIDKLEPENQVDVKKQVDEYTQQVDQFKKTVDQIAELDKTMKKTGKPQKFRNPIQKSREQIKF